MNKGRGFQLGWWLVLLTIGVMTFTAAPFLLNETYSQNLYVLCNEFVLVFPLIIGFFMINSDNQNISVGEAIGLVGFSPKIIPFLLLLAPSAQIFCGFLLTPVQSLMTLLFGSMDYDSLLNGGRTVDFVCNFISVCVLAPVLEEILCRGVIMQLFKRYGTLAMLIYSSLAFAILHQSAATFIPIFYLGLLLGIVKITTKSIFPCMILHSVNNLYALILLYAGESNALVEIFMLTIGVILFPILFWQYITKYSDTHAWCSELVYKGSSTGISVGLIICFLLFVLYNFSMFISRLLNGEIFYDISMLFG